MCSELLLFFFSEGFILTLSFEFISWHAWTISMCCDKPNCQSEFCVFVWVCMCIYTHTFICEYKCPCLYIHPHTYMYIYLCSCRHTCKCAHIKVECMRIFVGEFAIAYECEHIHTMLVHREVTISFVMNLTCQGIITLMRFCNIVIM